MGITLQLSINIEFAPTYSNEAVTRPRFALFLQLSALWPVYYSSIVLASSSHLIANTWWNLPRAHFWNCFARLSSRFLNPQLTLTNMDRDHKILYGRTWEMLKKLRNQGRFCLQKFEAIDSNCCRLHLWSWSSQQQERSIELLIMIRLSDM